MATAKIGRPRKYGKPLYFGMKVSSEEKASIKHLAQIENKPASQVILELVHQALVEKGIVQGKKKRLTTAELRSLSHADQQRILQEQAKAIAARQEIFHYNEDILEDL